MTGYLTLTRLAGPALAPFALLLALALGFSQSQVRAERATVGRLEERAAAAARDLAQARTNTATCSASLERQNAAVADLQRAGAERAAAAEKAVSDARSVAESFRKSAGRVLAAKPGPDACASADALIKEQLR